MIDLVQIIFDYNDNIAMYRVSALNKDYSNWQAMQKVSNEQNGYIGFFRNGN